MKITNTLQVQLANCKLSFWNLNTKVPICKTLILVQLILDMCLELLLVVVANTSSLYLF